MTSRSMLIQNTLTLLLNFASNTQFWLVSDKPHYIPQVLFHLSSIVTYRFKLFRQLWEFMFEVKYILEFQEVSLLRNNVVILF